MPTSLGISFKKTRCLRRKRNCCKISSLNIQYCQLTFVFLYQNTSTSGSNAVLSMKGQFSYDDGYYYDDYYYYDDDNNSSSTNTSDIVFDNWNIHSNEFKNPNSLYEMSSSQINAHQAFKINATNNYFALSSGANISSSLIDNRLFDDNEGDLSHPEILFEPYLTEDITFVCPSNCTENGICVFPGICICKDGWSGASCDTPTCQTLNFCNNNGICR